MTNEAKMIRMEKNVVGNTKTVARIEKIMPDSAETSKIANISSIKVAPNKFTVTCHAYTSADEGKIVSIQTNNKENAIKRFAKFCKKATSEIGTFSYESMPAGSNNDIDVNVIIDCDPEIDYHIEIQANNDGFTNDEVNHIVYDIASI